MNHPSRTPLHWDIFCRVIDNLGDAGVCWRLAVDLATRGEYVRIFIDHPEILPGLIGDSPAAQLVEVQTWPGDQQRYSDEEIADVVIEAFACDIPTAYLDAMSVANKPIAWINLEYLSAESWVESHHRMPSPHPRLALTKHFYFPGFTSGTGGLIREPEITSLLQSCEGSQPTEPEAQLKILLFSYEQPAIGFWLESIQKGNLTTTLSVTPCPAKIQVENWLNNLTDHENIKVDALEFVAQHEFDALLSRFDVLFVRGEDSFVRAQWAGKPLIWHIYPQEEDAHLIKLKAFYDRYLDQGVLSPAQRSIFWEFVLAWNSMNKDKTGDTLAELWPQLVVSLPALLENARVWRKQLLQQPDLVTQLRDFVSHLVKY
jgi:uncharacterized repeat protein (TIGR03837 family)